jgi:hypothetical protein
MIKCGHCYVLNGAKTQISYTLKREDTWLSRVFIASKRMNTWRNKPVTRCHVYALSLISRRHDESFCITGLFNESLILCEKLVAQGFSHPRILINSTGEHHHSWICLDQTDRDKALFDTLFDTFNGMNIIGVDPSLIKKIELASKPYDTDFVETMTIPKFQRCFRSPQTKHYIFCNYSFNSVVVATE